MTWLGTVLVSAGSRRRDYSPIIGRACALAAFTDNAGQAHRDRISHKDSFAAGMGSAGDLPPGVPACERPATASTPLTTHV